MFFNVFENKLQGFQAQSSQVVEHGGAILWTVKSVFPNHTLIITFLNSIITQLLYYPLPNVPNKIRIFTFKMYILKHSARINSFASMISLEDEVHP